MSYVDEDSQFVEWQGTGFAPAMIAELRIMLRGAFSKAELDVLYQQAAFLDELERFTATADFEKLCVIADDLLRSPHPFPHVLNNKSFPQPPRV